MNMYFQVWYIAAVEFLFIFIVIVCFTCQNRHKLKLNR